MAETDHITEVRTSLELMIQENANLLNHFEKLLQELDSLERLEPRERHIRFREIESRGGFELHGVDIRRFAPTAGRTVTAELFLRRTHRRLVNTIGMVNEFIRRGAFVNGKHLIADIERVTSHIVDEGSPREVVGFRERVDKIRESPLFDEYLELKRQFVREDPEFKTEAEIIAAKESAQENRDVLLSREAELNLIGDGVTSGKLSAEEAKRKLDELAFAFEM